MSETPSEIPISETPASPESKSEIIPEIKPEVKTEVEQEKKSKTVIDNIIHNTFPPVTKVSSELCVSYKFKWSDLILPPYEVLDTLCTSKDKTYMTIYTLVRILLYCILDVHKVSSTSY